jgi:hypothetical protein
MEGAKQVSCSVFGEAVINHMQLGAANEKAQHFRTGLFANSRTD